MEIIYLDNFDSNGLSNSLNVGELGEDIKETYSSAFINEVNSYFPERKRLHVLHPEWVSDNTIDIISPTTIKVSFVDEGAGYKNAFGYYIYDTETPPEKVSDIGKVYIIFPNASSNGKGGKLNAGDSMLLGSTVTTSSSGSLIVGSTTDYTFPYGKSVGFVIFANGWKRTYVNKNAPRYFTNSTLNPEPVDWLKYHTALVNTSQNTLVMGIEDLPRSRGYCDHDFNDLLVIITTDLSKISKGNYSDPNEVLENDPPISYDVGFKKVFVNVVEDGVTKVTEAICTLRIPLTSTIVKNTLSNKHRTDRAYVHQIVGCKDKTSRENSTELSYIGQDFDVGHSSFDATFLYNAHDWVISELNTDPEQHLDGIHFYRTHKEAEDYKFM